MFLRYSLSAISGLLMAATLLWMMQYLVTPADIHFEPASSFPAVQMMRIKRNEHIELKQRRKAPEPVKKIKPVARPRMNLTTKFKPNTPALDMSVSLQVPLLFSDAPALDGFAVANDRDFITLSRPAPQYPFQARRHGQEGWVKLAFTVTPTGGVKNITVLDSRPKGVFENAAKRALSRWRFKPRIVDNKPVSARAEQRIEFKLSN